MIYGIGVDMVEIPRMERVINKWGERFTKRIFTGNEMEFCLKSTKTISAFSMRFAAKEAFSKAIGFGMRQGIIWRDIEVVHNAYGRPGLNLAGRALDHCRTQGITGFYVTLSDEGDYSIAVVVLEKKG